MAELMPYAFFLFAGIAVGCGSQRAILNGMALVKVASIVQVVAFYPLGLGLGALLAFRFEQGILSPGR